MDKLSAIVILAILFGLTGTASAWCQSESKIPSSTPSARFSDNDDGTVTDNETGLMWAKCSEGLSGSDCSSGVLSTDFDWQRALKIAAASILAGHNNWRLPNTKELLSIVEERCYEPAINEEIFPNTGSASYWTSTPSLNSSYAWYVSFQTSSINEQFRDNRIGRVRLVRDL